MIWIDLIDQDRKQKIQAMLTILTNFPIINLQSNWSPGKINLKKIYTSRKI